MKRYIRKCRRAGITFAAIAGAALAAPVSADMLPAAKAIVQDLKVSDGILAGWEDEHKLPAGWLEAAKKTGELRIIGSWNPSEFRKMTAAFIERYPFMKINYTRGSSNTRTQQPLIAFKNGRHTADLLTGIGGAIFLFKEANALEMLTDVPNLRNIPEGMGSRDGIWAGIRTRYWCMSYNTNVLKKADLPKRWEDLLTNQNLRDGKMALGRLPQLWILPLWGKMGGDWTADYVRKIFSDVKPQLRKEGMDALVGLVIAGEFDAAVASADYRVWSSAQKGAPVAWHCPEPVPVAVSEAGILRGAPNVHAAKIFLNWLLSKEGQLSQYRTSRETPIHKDLMKAGFSPYPKEIEGKAVAFRSPDLIDSAEKEMFAVWHPLWGGSGETRGR